MRTQMEMPAIRNRRLPTTAELRGHETGFCRARGCQNATSDRKPYCVAHLDRLPYVRQILQELARREAEATAALGTRRQLVLDPAGTCAREILGELATKGALTSEQLGAALRIPPRVIESYVRVLEREGLVSTRRIRSRRGGLLRIVARQNAQLALRSAS